MKGIMTVDVEDWFNILDTDQSPPIEAWNQQEVRFDRQLDRLLEIFDRHGVKATFFWLGWFAEHHPEWVLRCRREGHEIASHGYAHLLAYQVGQLRFREDIRRGKKILEDITGEPVEGFRAAGFSTLNNTPWTFEEIAAAGYTYDSSVFPAARGHGGMSESGLDCYRIDTRYGVLWEFPQSMLEIGCHRVSLFGGGYLRLSPWWLLKFGVAALERSGRRLIIYLHPRDLDPDQPRLPLPLIRRFKCYVNLRGTYRKLDLLCKQKQFEPMGKVKASLC